MEDLKKSFEANLLDGDKVEDCGKAMLSAESVWQFLTSHTEDKIKELEGKFTIHLEKYKETGQNSQMQKEYDKAFIKMLVDDAIRILKRG